MGANVFISFASKDQKVAATLCSALEKRGFSCWISSRDIEPGDNFQSAIVSAIIASKVMLLVFTANSNSSDEMTKELALASQQKLIVVPLRVEDVAPNAAFSYEFATRQWIDLFVDWEKALDQLCERLTRAMPPETRPAGATAVPPVAGAAPAARKTPVGLLIAVAAAAVLVVGALIALPMLMAKKPAVQQATAPLAAPAAAPVAPPVATTTPVAPAAPAVAPPTAPVEAASIPPAQATPHASRAEVAAARTVHASENTHSDAYICAHGDDADYHTTQACDRKDQAANGN